MAVLNKKHVGIPPGAVYIGRGSRWGNPFTHIPSGTKATYIVKNRDEACDKYRAYLWQEIKAGRITVGELVKLHNKDLVCFCAPLRCHGHTLEKAAKWAFEQLNN